MTSTIPSDTQATRTFFAFYSASNPIDGEVNVENLEKVLAEDVKVSYLGYDSHQWNHLEGREAVIQIIDKVFKEKLLLKECNLQFFDGAVRMKTLSHIKGCEFLETNEVYTMKLIDGVCVIAKVVAEQKKVITSVYAYD